MYVHEIKVKFVFELSLIPKILHHVNPETGKHTVSDVSVPKHLEEVRSQSCEFSFLTPVASVSLGREDAHGCQGA